MPLLKKTRGNRLPLVFASMLLFLIVLSLLGGAGTAHAASTPSSHASIKPASIHGGGCSSNYWADPCISVNSETVVVPDVYIEQAYTDVYAIDLLRDGSVWTSDMVDQDFSAGTHLYGFSADAYSGHSWQTLVIVLTTPRECFLNGICDYAYIYSPTQYT